MFNRRTKVRWIFIFECTCLPFKDFFFFFWSLNILHSQILKAYICTSLKEQLYFIPTVRISFAVSICVIFRPKLYKTTNKRDKPKYKVHFPARYPIQSTCHLISGPRLDSFDHWPETWYKDLIQTRTVPSLVRW